MFELRVEKIVYFVNTVLDLRRGSDRRIKRKMHNKQFLNVYCSPFIIKLINPRTM